MGVAQSLHERVDARAAKLKPDARTAGKEGEARHLGGTTSHQTPARRIEPVDPFEFSSQVDPPASDLRQGCPPVKKKLKRLTVTEPAKLLKERRRPPVQAARQARQSEQTGRKQTGSKQRDAGRVEEEPGQPVRSSGNAQRGVSNAGQNQGSAPGSSAAKSDAVLKLSKPQRKLPSKAAISRDRMIIEESCSEEEEWNSQDEEEEEEETESTGSIKSVASIDHCRLDYDNGGVHYLVKDSRGRTAWVPEHRLPRRLLREFVQSNKTGTVESKHHRTRDQCQDTPRLRTPRRNTTVTLEALCSSSEADSDSDEQAQMESEVVHQLDSADSKEAQATSGGPRSVVPSTAGVHVESGHSSSRRRKRVIVLSDEEDAEEDEKQAQGPARPDFHAEVEDGEQCQSHSDSSGSQSETDSVCSFATSSTALSIRDSKPVDGHMQCQAPDGDVVEEDGRSAASSGFGRAEIGNEFEALKACEPAHSTPVSRRRRIPGFIEAWECVKYPDLEVERRARVKYTGLYLREKGKIDLKVEDVCFEQSPTYTGYALEARELDSRSPVGTDSEVKKPGIILFPLAEGLFVRIFASPFNSSHVEYLLVDSNSSAEERPRLRHNRQQQH